MTNNNMININVSDPSCRESFYSSQKERFSTVNRGYEVEVYLIDCVGFLHVIGNLFRYRN